MQIAFLGLIVILLGLVTDSCYALLAGCAGSWLKRSGGHLRFQRYFSGTIFLGLGLAAAFAGSQKK